MPPKNKGKSKKPAKARSPVLINGLTKDEMSKEQMEEHAAQLREGLDREREERNYFQLERDKMYGFMENTERELEEEKAQLKNVHKDIEEDERRHQAEIKVYKQKMKHVLCEHQNMVSGLQADAAVSAEAMEKEQEELETGIRVEREAIAVDMQDVDSEKLAWEIELQKHNEEITKLRDSGEKQLAEVVVKYERKMELLPQEMENIRKTQISDRRQFWDNQIAARKKEHNTTVSGWDVVIAHMKQDADLSLSLKAQIKDRKMKRGEKEADLACVLQDNKCLTDSFLKLEQKITETEKKAGTFTSDKDPLKSLENMRRKELNGLKSENEALEMEFQKLEQERDELQKTVNEKIQKVQREGDERILLQEPELKALTDRLDKTQAQIASVVSASNVDPAALDVVLKKVEEQLDASNNTIKMLQMRKAQIRQVGENLLTSEAKLRTPDVPEEELARSVQSLTVEDVYT